uniref:B30.2/SPRY domain-containing protein n=2 Tax=Panagrellus redivivus TaxID=6233 RepID=A0A7E5A0M4_PANRE
MFEFFRRFRANPVIPIPLSSLCSDIIMVNSYPVTLSARMPPPPDPDPDLHLYLGPRRLSLLSDDAMDTSSPSPTATTYGLGMPLTVETSSCFSSSMDMDVDDVAEDLPATDEIYHAIVRFVDASEAAQGHFVPVEAPVIEDTDEEMLGDTLSTASSGSSDSESDSTASWKSLASNGLPTTSRRAGEDNENRSGLINHRSEHRERSTPPATPSSSARHSGIRAVAAAVAYTAMPSLFDRRNRASSRHQTSSVESTGRSRDRRVSKTASPRGASNAAPSSYAHLSLDDMARPSKMDVVMSMPPPDAATLEKYAWNPEDRSLNIYVKEDDPLTFHRHPVAQSTDCIRGKVGYSNGFHVWQITWPKRQRGTHAVVGVCTKEAPLHHTGYVSLIGQNTESYGWDIIRNKCSHNGKATAVWAYPTITDLDPEDATPSNIGDSFYCILDMDEGFMAFATDKQFLGVAFRGLKGKKLYPVVSAVWGHCEVTMKYMGGLDPEPRQLMDVCRRSIRASLGPARLNRANELPLPPSLQRFILYKDHEIAASRPAPYPRVTSSRNEFL